MLWVVLRQGEFNLFQTWLICLHYTTIISICQAFFVTSRRLFANFKRRFCKYRFVTEYLVCRRKLYVAAFEKILTLIEGMQTEQQGIKTELSGIHTRLESIETEQQGMKQQITSIRMGYGFRNIDNLIALVILKCGGDVITLPCR